MAINNTTIAPPANTPNLSATFTNGNLVSSTAANPQAVAAGEPSSNAYGGQTNVQTGNPVNFTPNANTASTVGLNTTTPTTQPVVTSQAAEDDVNNKYSVMKNLQAQLAGQSANVQNAALQQAATKAENDYNQAELSLKQQTVNNQTTTANAQAAAVAAAASPDGATPAPTTAPATTSGTVTGSDYNDILGNNLNQYQSDSNNLSNEQDSLVSNWSNALTSITQGIFPLDPIQISIIAQMQNQLQASVASQQVANSSYVGQITAAAYRSGGGYTPEQMTNQISAAINLGQTRITNLDSAAGLAISQVTQGFQKQDFDMVNENYQILQNSLDKKSTEITNMYNTVTSALKDQRDAAASAAQTAFTDSMESNKFDYQKSQDIIDNAFKQGQITEQQYKDSQDLINQRTTTALKEYEDGLTGSNFNPATGSFTTTDGSASSTNPTTIPGYTKLSNGMSIISNVTGTFKTPSIGGIPVVSAQDTKTVNEAANASMILNQMQELYPTVRGQDSALAQYNALKASLPSSIQSIVPSIGIAGGVFDSTSNANSGFSSARNSLSTEITSAIPGSHPPPYGQVFTSPSAAQQYFTSTSQMNEYQAEVTKANSLAETHFGRPANDGEILQIINGQ